MVSLAALRQHPRFGRFFEVVHPFCWPVIWWTLNAVFRQYDASNCTEFLLGITWWDQVYIAFEGDLRPDPHASKPIPRTFRPLTDESWGSDLPANLEGLSPSLSSPISGGSVRTLCIQMKGSQPYPHNTS